MTSSHAEFPLAIYGVGGHGRVVAEAAQAAGMTVLGFLDDLETETPESDQSMLEPEDPQLAGAVFIVAVGDNMARRRLTNDLLAAHRRLTAVIHPAAYVAASATVERGAFVGPGAVVHTNAHVGRGAIINSAAVVEHDCRIGEFAHIAPGAVLGGQVTVDSLSLVGLGARVLPGLHIGEACVIGAGAAVVRDASERTTVLGVPANVRSLEPETRNDQA